MYPMKLIPAYKDYLWGGNRIESLFQKHSGLAVTAESWELSCHPDGASVIENGVFAGKSLVSLLAQNPRFVHSRHKPTDDFPIMVKFIDAAQDLSVQVHPSDHTALTELGEHGKAEMWYVVKAEPRSYIYWGFNQKLTGEQLLALAESGEICRVMNRIRVHEGDVFYILPGTIHAIGKGCLMAEIQQNSNSTFRVFDYNRIGADGKKRPLHLARAAAVLNYEPIVPDRSILSSSISTPDFTHTIIFECSHFKVSKIDCKKTISLLCTQDSFFSLLFIHGAGQLVHGASQYEFSAGDSYFLPAGLGHIQIHGAFTALLSRI